MPIFGKILCLDKNNNIVASKVYAKHDENYMPASIQNKLEEIHVLRSNASWFGVTYKQDKPEVKRKINELINSEIYPSHLFE